MATLQEILNPDVAPQFVADCQALIDGEVDGKGGLSGTAVTPRQPRRRRVRQ